MSELKKNKYEARFVGENYITLIKKKKKKKTMFQSVFYDPVALF